MNLNMNMQSGNDVTSEVVTFSVVTKCDGEGILTKRLDLVDGEIVKDSSQCRLSLGTIETIRCSIEKFADDLRKLAPNQALVHGVSEHDKAIICSRHNLEEIRLANADGNYPVICRSKEYLSYPGCVGLLMLDHDKAKDNSIAIDTKALKSFKGNELIDAISSVFPEMTGAAWVSTPSTSSCINDSVGNELRGEGDGSHTYLFPKDARDVERFSKVIGQRLILAGFGRIEFSATGSMLVRTIVDLAVGSPERLDFAAGAVCGEGLEQRLPDPYLHKGTLLDTSLLPDLTIKEQLKYDDIIENLKAKAKPTKYKIQKDYTERKVNELVASGVDENTARSNIKSRFDNILDDDLLLYFVDGSTITVGKLLETGSKYDHMSLADPLEPEYDNWSRSKAKYYWNDGTPKIHSFAHGKIIYRFKRFEGVIEREDVYLPAITEPIDPDKFRECMSDAIKALNPDFFCEGVMQQVFYQACATYNDNIDLNNKGESVILVIPTATGSGKSVSMREYASLIAMQGMSCLLVVSEIETAIDTAEQINSKSGSNVARAYYTLSQEHPEDDLWCDIEALPEVAVAVITHALFIARSYSGKQIDLLKNYKGKQRNLIVVDERIDLVKRDNFGTDEVPDLVAVLMRDGRLKNVISGLNQLTKLIESSRIDGSYEYTGKLKGWLSSFNVSLQKLSNEIKDGKYDLRRKMRGRYNPYDDRDSTVDLIKRISYVISDRFTQVREGGNIVCHREECLADKFGSVVILDATSTINPEYDYRSINGKNIRMIKKIPSRNYANVVLNICTDSRAKQSATSLFHNPTKDNKLSYIIDSYIGIIDSILKDGDKLLVATYKELVPHFKNLSSYGDQVKFIYWGSSDTRGSNDFNSFNKALVIGFFRKPKHYYIQSLSAINLVGAYMPMKGSMVADANYLRDMLIIDDMIQFFNRVRCRTAIDADGNCLPVELYCFTGGNEYMFKLIKSSCSIEMPNIQIRDWEPKDIHKITIRETVDEKRAVNLVEHLCGKIGREQEVYLKDLLSEFELSSSSGTRVIKNEVFKKLLDDAGIVFVPSHGGHKNPATFILPKSKI